MKVIFLDFDGVLNSVLYAKTEEYQTHAGGASWHSVDSLKWWSYGLDATRVELLNQLVERTGAKVVISSSWRLGATQEWLVQVLVSRGFRGEVVGVTPAYGDEPRCKEIEGWIEVHRPESYVVIDDDADAEIRGRFVLTSSHCGLTAEDVDEAVRILEKV